MALTAAQLETLRDSLTDALAGGVLKIRDQNGEQVEYRSAADLRAAVAAVNREIAALGGQPRTGPIRFRTSKGL